MSMTTQGIKTTGQQSPDVAVENGPKTNVVVTPVKPASQDFGKGVESNGPDDYQKDGTPKY